MKIISTSFLILVSLFSHCQEISKVQPFLPEIISKFPTVRDITISPSQDEIYFTAQGYSGELSTIIKIVKKGNQWSTPEVAPFSGQYRDLEAMFSPDGLKLYYVSTRPLDNQSTEAKDHDIWYIERSSKTAKWSKPKNLGSPINTKDDEFYPSVAKNGNLYFTSTASTSKGKDDIFMSSKKNNQYTKPVSLSSTINSEGYEYNAYIAPDESFLLFGGYKRNDGLGSGDIYISYKNKDGDWEQAKNLTKEVNSDKMDYCPFYDIKTQTLYFTSKRTALKKQLNQPKTIKQLLEMMNSYENGLSRIYAIPIKF